jgi:F-type H+-transporting ATPase subunit delta
LIRIIAKRYAKALVQLAEEKKAVDQTRADMDAFIGAVNTLPAMQKLFASPVLPPDSKKAVIRELAGKLNLQPTTQRFLEHLAETGRIRYVKDLHEAFLDILAQRQNRATVRLTTAAPLNNGDMADIKTKLEILTGKQVDIDSKVDASLIGGAKAQIGSTIYDGTIKNQLDKMRMKLVS